MVDPMFWLSWVTSDLPGWFQSDRTIGNGSSPHWLRSASQLSWVQRTMRRVLLVTVQSIRMFSCRQLLQLPATGVVLGRFMRFIIAWPPGLIRSGGMMFPGKGWPVRGSMGVGEEQPGRLLLKLPARSSAVGTNDVRTSLRLSLFHSRETKKWSLSLMMGPPKVPP